ncbi:MAG TPA: S9 family peptidase [Ktedonobacterales bacterium]
MPRNLTPEDLYAIAQVTDPRISPDGTRIAYVRTDIDRDTYEYQTTLWIVPTDGDVGASDGRPPSSSGEPRQFTAGPKDSAPRWSPDGSQLAFLRVPAGTSKPKSLDARDRGDGKPQLYLIAADGGEARRLTHLREGAGPAEWSPDGATLLFSAETGTPDDAEAEDASVEGKNVPRVRSVEQLFYRFDGHGYIYEHRAHLFTLAVEGVGASGGRPSDGERPGDPRQITDGDWSDAAPTWSPDGKQIAFTSDRTPERWRFPASQVWVIDAPGAVGASGGRLEPRRLSSEALGTAAPTWSPDGQRIAFLAAPRRGETGHTDLYVVDAGGPAESERLLTGDFTPVCSDRCIDDQRAAHELGHLAWAPNGSAIYFLGSLRGESQLYAARPGDGDLLPYSVTQGMHHVYGFSLDRDGRSLALAISDPLTPGDIYVQPVPPSGPAAEEVTPRRLTDVNGALLAEVALAAPREFSFTGADGWEMQGWVMRPADAPEGKPLPAILQIHGGPAYMYGYSFFLEFQVLAAQGYAVVYSNPRGSTGYGRVFCHAVTHGWGGKDCEDILAGLDAAIARGGIDGSRLGVAGGSYGGYMTNWIVGHSDRFKAAVTMRCVSNFATMFGMSDIGYALSLDEIGGAPWEDLDTLMRHSPITYVGNVTTPLLILHSDQDLRCPLGEAQQMYAALKYRDQPTKLVVFEGQSHDLSRNGHPRSRVRRLREIGDWLARYNPLDA